MSLEHREWITELWNVNKATQALARCREMERVFLKFIYRDETTMEMVNAMEPFIAQVQKDIRLLTQYIEQGHLLQCHSSSSSSVSSG